MKELSEKLIDTLIRSRITTVCGVPDSVLSSFSDAVEACGAVHHVVCPNEGLAVSYGTGAFLATGIPSVVYMQSAGIGNAYNPLISMASVHVCGIPMILIIGWRGEPGTDDEPQHLHQGEALLPTLDILNIEYKIVDADNVESVVSDALKKTLIQGNPIALIISRRDVLGSRRTYQESSRISRRDAILAIVSSVPADALFVAATGYAARELHDILNLTENSSDRAFLMIGAMGHAAQLAMGLAHWVPDRVVVCIDGDGSMQMHLGSLGLAKIHEKCRFIHIVINNGCQDSVGGQIVANPALNYARLANEFGYPQATLVDSVSTLHLAISNALRTRSEHFIEVLAEPNAQHVPPRPITSPADNKVRFRSCVSSHC